MKEILDRPGLSDDCASRIDGWLQGAVSPAVCLDLDGTLKVHGSRPSPSAARLLRRLAALGIPLVLATGRSLPSLRMVTAHGWPDRFDALICLNGALVLTARPFVPGLGTPSPLSLNVLLLAESVADFAVETPSGLLYTDRYLPYEVAPPGSVVCGRQDLLAEEALMLVAPQAAQKRLEQIEGVAVHSSGQGFVEVSDAGVDKIVALHGVASALGIGDGVADFLAIGDGPNDAAMLRTVGLGIAVEGGSDAARIAAATLCPGPLDNGPLQVLAHIVRALEGDRGDA